MRGSPDVDAVVRHARAVTGRAFATRDLVIAERFGFWMVRLANDLMAYVAKDDVTRDALVRERRIVARVASRVSFRVPRPLGSLDDEARSTCESGCRGRPALRRMRR